jgi:threonine/homoserine/homoserine lactone efflux protein
MPTIEVFLAYTLACILVILSPGPDNILAVSRGLSQGKRAAIVTSAAAATGLLLHVMAAAFGLAIILQTSQSAFMVLKIVGASYLIWLGVKALSARNLISFSKTHRLSMRAVYWTGFLTNLLNPKPAIFILAFVPQFIRLDQGSMTMQMLIFGVWFAVLAFAIFATLGCMATAVSDWLEGRPRATFGLNIGAGLALIGAGFSVIAIGRS